MAAKNIFRLVKTWVGYTTEEFVRDGNYHYANLKITSKNFPIRSQFMGDRDIILLEFDRDVTSEEATVEAMKFGLERPVYEDALRFGVEYPNVQCERLVVFFHEPWCDPNGSSDVLYLLGRGGYRKISLCYFGGRWLRKYRFAFVCK